MLSYIPLDKLITVYSFIDKHESLPVLGSIMNKATMHILFVAMYFYCLWLNRISGLLIHISYICLILQGTAKSLTKVVGTFYNPTSNM
jgi:hypothetical protein